MMTISDQSIMQNHNQTVLDTVKRQTAVAKKKRSEIIRLIKPSCVQSWHWSNSGFEEAAAWLRTHPHEIRHGLYMSDTPGKEVWHVSIPSKLGGFEIVMTSYVNAKSFWDMFTLSEAWNEVRNSVVMKSLGIPTPKILACGEERSWGKVSSSYVVSEYIPASLSGKVLMPGGQLREEKQLRRAFSMKAMELIARAHKCHFYHHDFRPGKMLMAENSTVDDMRLTMIDMYLADFRMPFASDRLLLADDLLAFFVDMRPTTKEIKELCEYYLYFNSGCGYTVESLWNKLVSMGEDRG